jgi:predicted MFS family arabinose efflux permease
MTDHAPSDAVAKRNVLVLSLCQALSMTGASLVILVSALAAQTLADDKSLVTLPIAFQFTATMLTTIPASLLMGKIGRKLGFTLGQVIGVCGAALASYAIFEGNFWLFALASAMLGSHNAFWQYYRFAAADTASGEFKAKAISLVMAGGVFAAVAGPQLGKWSVDLFSPVLFVGCYVVIIALSTITIFMLQGVSIPKPTTVGISVRGRPLGEIMRQPVFIVAVISAMFGYSVMTLVMTATPLAMAFCGFDFSDTGTVIQFHALAMFAPSFFTGHLIKKFGVLHIIIIGAILNVGCMAVNLMGIEFANFWIGLMLLGLGWNFMFVGGTTLLTEAYRPEEKSKVQAANDFIVFGAVSVAAFSSGALFDIFGWAAVNAAVTLPMLIAFVAAVWFLLVHNPQHQKTTS